MSKLELVLQPDTRAWRGDYTNIVNAATGELVAVWFSAVYPSGCASALYDHRNHICYSDSVGYGFPTAIQTVLSRGRDKPELYYGYPPRFGQATELSFKQGEYVLTISLVEEKGTQVWK